MKKKEKRKLLQHFIDKNIYCSIFETQFQTVLLFKTYLEQFQTFWASEICLQQDGLYRDIYHPLTETPGKGAIDNKSIGAKQAVSYYLNQCWSKPQVQHTSTYLQSHMLAFEISLWKFYITLRHT